MLEQLHNSRDSFYSKHHVTGNVLKLYDYHRINLVLPHEFLATFGMQCSPSEENIENITCL